VRGGAAADRPRASNFRELAGRARGEAVTGVPSKAMAVDEEAEGREPVPEMQARAAAVIVMGLQERGPPSCRPLPHIHVS
jgi:hypothetical protein